MTISDGFQPIVAVLAFDGVVLGDLAIPCEVFGRAGYDVRVCSETSRVSSAHVAIAPHHRLASLSKAHTVIVPGVESLDGELSVRMGRALERAVDRGARVASICTGAFLLAQTGLLDGKRATTHWRAAAELARRHPAVQVDPNVLYVDEGSVLTSAGAVAGLDLCLHMVRCDRGAAVAAEVAKASVMPLERAGGQAQFITPPASPEDGSSLAPTLEWARLHLDQPLSVPALAKHAGMSTRTFNRRFREQTSTTPARWLNRERVHLAQHQLETTDSSIERIAATVGFGSATSLREHFRRVLNTSPQAYRRAFVRAG